MYFLPDTADTNVSLCSALNNYMMDYLLVFFIVF